MFANNVAATITRQLLALACGVLTTSLLARCLGPAGRGEYAIASLFAALITYFSTLGTGQAAIFYAAKGAHSSAEVLANSIALWIGLSLASALVAFTIVAEWAGSLLPGVPKSLLLLAVAVAPLQLLFGLVTPVLMGNQQVRLYYTLQVARAVAFLLGVAAFVGQGRFGPVGALLAEALAFALAAVIALGKMQRWLPGWFRRVSLSYIKRALQYGLRSYCGTILIFLHQRADVFLMSAYLTPPMVGLYAVSIGLAEKVSLFAESTATVLFPKVSATTGKNDSGFTALVLRTTLLFVSAAALVLTALAPMVITALYSRAFAAAVVPFSVLLWGAVARSGWLILESDLRGRGRPGGASLITLLGVITNLFCNVLWIPRYGIVGAAWASTLANLLCLVVHLTVHASISGQGLSHVVLPGRTDLLAYRRLLLNELAIAGGRAVLPRLCPAFLRPERGGRK